MCWRSSPLPGDHLHVGLHAYAVHAFGQWLVQCHDIVIIIVLILSISLQCHHRTITPLWSALQLMALHAYNNCHVRHCHAVTVVKALGY